MLRETLLYEKLINQAVRCCICQRRCRIAVDEWGFCHTRVNRKGKLFSTIYGNVSYWRKAPIEIKPVYHYLPGSHALSLGSLGCNFLCPGCQNWDISFSRVDNLSTPTETISTEEAVKIARQNRCQGISWTYNEPVLWFEYTLDGAKLAKKAGLYTNYVTNGYITQEALDTIGPYLDVYRVDIKGFNQKTYRKIANLTEWTSILECASRARKKWQMHVEVVTNVIPGINDAMAQLRDMAHWIRTELGADTPWHITRFFPRWKLKNIAPTSLRKLEAIREQVMGLGLKYIYLGNVGDHPANHTYCPTCGNRLIDRLDWEKVRSTLDSGKCPSCGEMIYGRF